ncbi:dehydrogenase/reductase SDR family member on chromosome X [Aethina tumida]|uniref:dehydrogenase/reductase SDR family member on chromosome X n=1 Tax=Aethina tumida TaxID=116153 RepID=UPI0021488D28|nr:dehydrogenase/reductase SDR family member on chromosome X [Aethina tumida]XP_049825353.1 dehydrogenase/reductase SDR family member on chromosome X [Aethina tumida]XP_049825354.1 dehydrogenase/reductase SDR family member on chromosome X [Aethina tumida]
MFLIVGFCLVVVITGVAIVRSKKPLKLILAEAKYELMYNAVGSKGVLEDYLMRAKNKTELPLKPGKVAVITGGNRGIGKEVVKMFLKCDMTVVMGCRNIQAAEAMIKTLRDAGVEAGKTEVFNLDISVIESVKNFANKVKAKYPKINYAVNNAGIMFGPYIETKDGYESQFSTNYLGHFLLIHLLLPNIKAGGDENENARIVNVSSCAHLIGDIKFEDINNRKQYIPGAAYSQSKLAQVLFSNHLDNVLKESKSHVQVHSVHPGVVNTDLFDGTPLKNYAPWILKLFKSPRQGAVPIVYTCLSKDLEGKGGTYIHNCRIHETSELAKSVELQEKLFNFTNKLLKIDDFGK